MIRSAATASPFGRRPFDPRNSYIGQVARTKSLPSPVGGWNVRDSLAAMPPLDAVRLENWVPRSSYCEIRGGSANYVTGLPSRVRSLMVFATPRGAQKLFGVSGTHIYDVTTAGAVGGAVANVTNDRWQYINYAAVSATHYLLAVNGVDSMYAYDGTTWQAVTAVSVPIAITGGLTTSNIINIFEFKERIFLIEKNRLSFWYLPVASVGGVAAEFVLDSFMSKGGTIVAGATWTIDGGSGQDDFAVFVTSEGQVAVFQGSNPGDPGSWQLIGVYDLGRPMGNGRKCLMKYGGDLLYNSQNGLWPLSKSLLAASIDRTIALSDKIDRAFTDAWMASGAFLGWDLTLYSTQNTIIVNVPTAEDTSHVQYVMNTKTRAWCKFTGWNAECFAVFQGQLYFGDTTTVVKAWSGGSDVGGVNIVADAKQAFNYLGGPDVQKTPGLMRPVLLVNGTLNFKFGINVDFEDLPAVGTAIYTVPASALWDTALWDQSVWGADLQVQKDWRTPPAKPGYCFAPLLYIVTNKLTVQWPSTDLSYMTGGVL